MWLGVANVGVRSTGFLPVRQLVLVDLLSMVLAVRPGERAVVAVDTANAEGTARLCAELRALAAHVGGRELPSVHAGDLGDHGVATMLRAFRSGEPTAGPGGTDVDPDGPVSSGSSADDAVLLVSGAFLLRPPVAAQWDASVYVETQASVSDAEHLYREQAPEQQATWVLDDRRRESPTLTYGRSVQPG